MELDLAYLRTHPETIPLLVEHQRIRVTPLGGAHGGRTERWTLDDGTHLFAKLARADPDTGAGAGAEVSSDAGADAGPAPLVAEGRALRWLAEPGVAAIPEVLLATPAMLVLTWVETGPASPAGAEWFGRELAALHAAGAPTFGLDSPGALAGRRLDNTPEPDWPMFYVKHRCVPFLHAARDAGALTRAEVAVVEGALERIAGAAGPPEPPARLHGDLWAGNVLPGRDGRWWLIDPAAHGGHRETDLAMLALFGAPHLDRVRDAYAEVSPLAEGWRDRVGLHQLHPLLVHCALFGSGYAARTVAAARSIP